MREVANKDLVLRVEVTLGSGDTARTFLGSRDGVDSWKFHAVPIVGPDFGGDLRFSGLNYSVKVTEGEKVWARANGVVRIAPPLVTPSSTQPLGGRTPRPLEGGTPPT